MRFVSRARFRLSHSLAERSESEGLVCQEAWPCAGAERGAVSQQMPSNPAEAARGEDRPQPPRAAGPSSGPQPPVGGSAGGRFWGQPRPQPGLLRCPSGALWAGGALLPPAPSSPSLESWVFQQHRRWGQAPPARLSLAAVCGLSEFLRLCPNKNNKVVNAKDIESCSTAHPLKRTEVSAGVCWPWGPVVSWQ